MVVMGKNQKMNVQSYEGGTIYEGGTTYKIVYALLALSASSLHHLNTKYGTSRLIKL